ncbi:ubiquitin elongating factor core-domain-containing protein [Suillus subalutaceus]|uniref:ubiquitin elongating factor core-domain-containing protein n=1 Tax=Suillus subalutaceus TaxID=48586 RepID=UPI001B875C6F|nr:ubiquitin elongating factor core-domain-containing protein [Suillus subalutaceus]KAG1833993.1 ubiquitin elongating factor core-domain-containing protein [Suillus subalutaceus]
MSEPTDADRIRAKRLAKLQAGSTSSSPTPSPASPGPSSSTPVAQLPHPKQKPPSIPPQSTTPPPQRNVPLKRKSTAPAPKVDYQTWEHDTISTVLKVTLSKSTAEANEYDLVWLKHLQAELESDGYPHMTLTNDIVDRLLIARLELDAQAMSDDLEYVSVLASLPPQSIFEYLVGCWKRINTAKSTLLKKNPVSETQQATALLDKLRDLVISYTGLNLQEPEMFPQPANRPLSTLGSHELLTPLLSLSALSTPLYASTTTPQTTLAPTEVQPFLQDLAARFTDPDELLNTLSTLVRTLVTHTLTIPSEGIGGSGGDSAWRGVIGGMEALVGVKPIAEMIMRMPQWLGEGFGVEVTAANFERLSLMGPLLRLGTFSREWPGIAQTYFSDPTNRSRADVESSNASLRGTLKSLQSSLFQIFNTLVRTSPEARERVLEYFATVVRLNVKRAGMQVEPDTVASDSFMVNLQSVLLRFAEPFMDARYTKMDRIDPYYFSVSTRIDLKEETRIKATSDEATQWVEESKSKAATPNFISDIFYLCNALGHYGYIRTIQVYEDLGKTLDDYQRHHDMIAGDGSWMGTPQQAHAQAAIDNAKNEMSKIQSQQLAYRVQLLDPELVFRYIGFTNFASTWLIRSVDPQGTHPNPVVELPLPKNVPMTFRVLPEFIIEDVVEFLLFVVRHSPESLDLSGKDELVIFALTFLTSTWYIKNPFLKAKINEAVFYGVLPYGNDRHGILGHTLNTHPVALKNLIPALTHFYIEVEQTGASSQFYDKFNARRNIAYILKAVWDNPVHRDALNKEAQNVDKFIRFINLMINDVTYLMDESLSELTQIHNIQTEMRDQAAWNARPQQYRREREGTLRGLERHASGYTTLGRSTVGLLKDFTAETKGPFMMPEIVDKLAAMLDYNLDALVGPKCGELRVQDPEKYKFNPRQLLSDILQVYINLSDQEEFVRAVANDGRSYRKELFEAAMETARRVPLKTEAEIGVVRSFVSKVEEMKTTIEAEEDLGEIPEEFLDPLMATIMRDPVTLPSSRAIVDRSTIKSHLLSDSKDPFNRVPMVIEDVMPNVELKAQIDAFITERRNKRLTIEEGIVKMDVSMD